MTTKIHYYDDSVNPILKSEKGSGSFIFEGIANYQVENYKYHPECNADEYFVGNFRIGDLTPMTFKSSRFGKVAYDYNGHIVKDSVPLFVKKTEIEKIVLSNS